MARRAEHEIVSHETSQSLRRSGQSSTPPRRDQVRDNLMFLHGFMVVGLSDSLRRSGDYEIKPEVPEWDRFCENCASFSKTAATRLADAFFKSTEFKISVGTQDPGKLRELREVMQGLVSRLSAPDPSCLHDTARAGTTFPYVVEEKLSMAADRVAQILQEVTGEAAETALLAASNSVREVRKSLANGGFPFEQRLLRYSPVFLLKEGLRVLVQEQDSGSHLAQTLLDYVLGYLSRKGFLIRDLDPIEGAGLHHALKFLMDSCGLQRFLKEHRKNKFLFCRAFGVPGSWCGDLWDEGMNHAYLQLGKFRFESTIQTWLGCVILEYAREEVAKRRDPRLEQIEGDGRPEWQHQTEMDAELADQPVTFDVAGPPPPGYRLALSALPERDRRCFDLWFEGGYTVAEIGRLERITTGVVRSRLANAKRKLADTLKGR